MIKTVYYECGCVFEFAYSDGKVVVLQPFTLCYKHGFDMYHVGDPKSLLWKQVFEEESKK
jgi:hypothetical protein